MSATKGEHDRHPRNGLVEVKLFYPVSERVDVRVTPKGLAWHTMLECGLATQESGDVFDVFWAAFSRRMKQCGY